MLMIGMIGRFRGIGLGIFCALWLANCASTVQSRIEKNPQVFGSLSPEQQRLAREGKITKGMPKGGVFLAWGAPDRVTVGSKADETWRYRGFDPVYTDHFGFEFGSGYGYGRHAGYFYHPDVLYVPFTAGIVRFTDDKVVEWEALKWDELPKAQ